MGGIGSNVVPNISYSESPDSTKSIFKRKYGINIDNSYFSNNGDIRILSDTDRLLAKLDKLLPIKELIGDINLNSVVFADYFNKYPQYAKAWALSREDYSKSIYVNSQYFNNYTDSLERYNSVPEHKYIYNSSLGNIILHEVGHQYEYALSKMNGIDVNDLGFHNVAQAIVTSSYDELPKGTFSSLDDAIKSISGYANTKFELLPGLEIHEFGETFAEAISDYVTNGSKSSPLSQQIVKNIKIAFGKEG